MNEITTEEKSKENPSFFSIIPANVRYSKNISWAEKVIYSEISCLTNKYGYCYAKNSYFADVYGISKDSVSRILKNLETNNFISMTVIRNDRKEVIERRITINTSPNNCIYLPEDLQGGGGKNAKDNNTSINNINLNTLITSSLRSEGTHFVRVTAKELEVLKSNVDKSYLSLFDLLTKNEDGTYETNVRFNSELIDTLTPSLVDNFMKLNSESKREEELGKEKEGVPPEEKEKENDNLNNSGCEVTQKASQTNEEGSTIDSFEKVDNFVEESKKSSQKADFSSLGLVKGSDYQADNNPPKKAKRKSAAKPKEMTDLQKVKYHFLDNRKKLFEEGKVETSLDCTNSALINKRLNALFDMGITVEQFYKVFDLAMTDDFCVRQVGYSFQKMLTESVFMRLYNDKRAKVVEKKPEPMKHIKVVQKCTKCGEELNSFGTCSFCD